MHGFFENFRFKYEKTDTLNLCNDRVCPYYDDIYQSLEYRHEKTCIERFCQIKAQSSMYIYTN